MVGSTGVKFRRIPLLIVLALALVAAVLPAVATAAPSTACDGDYVSLKNNKWTVLPNGADDTANVSCALDEAALAGGRPVVELAEGDFHLDFIDSTGFSGTLKGAGLHETYIRPPVGGFDCMGREETEGFVPWLRFLKADLEISQMSFDIPTPACAEPRFVDVFFDEEAGVEVGFIGEDIDWVIALGTRPNDAEGCGLTGHGSFNGHDLSITSTLPDFTTPIFNPQGVFGAFAIGGSLPSGCVAWDDMIGDVNVSDIYASGIGNAVTVAAVVNSDITVKRVHGEDMDTPLQFLNNEKSRIDVLNNEFHLVNLGVLADNCVFGPEGPDCLEDEMDVRVIKNNIHVGPGGFTGVLIADNFLGPNEIDARIADNTIDTYGEAAVFLTDAQDVRVTNNTIRGESPFGVLVVDGSNNNTIRNNNFGKHVAFEASVLLDEFTFENAVSNNHQQTVVDLGTDNKVTP